MFSRDGQKDGYRGCLWIVLLLCCGCASVAKKTDPAELSRIEAGKSNKDDVLKILGLPNKRAVKTSETDEQMELWVYYKGGGRRSISVPFIPTGQSIDLAQGELIMGLSLEFQSTERENIAAIVAFDERGVVVDMKTEGNER